MKLVLNLLYSDTRADAGHQLKPAAWSNLDFSSLEKIVEEYTATTIKHFKESGSLPDIIQIGNDITSGLLWPDGKLEGERSDYAQWDRFSRLLKAGVRGARRHLDKTDKVRIILHVDCGADISTTKWFFDNINEQNVPYDIIGLSYYPWKHGTMENLRLYLNKTAKAFGKDIIIVETAYPYNEKLWVLEKINMDWPISEKGQKKFLSDLINTVSTTTNNLGIGILYWFPESIPVMGIDIWNNGATALFDAKGNALPALKAFNPKSNQHQ